MPLFNLNTGYLNSVSKTTTYTATPVEDIIYCDASGGAWTLTVPAAASNSKKIFCFKKTDTSFNAITISGTGMTTNYLMTVGETAWFQSDGSNWVQIHRKTDTGWISFTPTGVWVSGATYSGRWKRVGDSIIIEYQIETSGAVTGTLTLNIPNSAGWTINTGKIFNSGSNDTLGTLSMLETANDNFSGTLGYSSTTAIAALYYGVAGSLVVRRPITATGPFAWASGDFLFAATRPIPITNFSA